MSGFRIITADERLAAPRTIKGVIFGPHGIGKTSLLTHLDPKTSLLIDLEAGDLALGDFPVAKIKVRTWEEARDLACLVGGPNPALRPEQPYSQAHYDHLTKSTPIEFFDPFETYFWDSISVASRLCFQWATGQPAAFSDKTGKPDMRGAYGLVGRELTDWFTQIQHTVGKNIWLVGGLDTKTDDFNRPYYDPQIMGNQAAHCLPGIFDQIVSMVDLKTPDGTPYRAFVCYKINPWGYPAKDRSGRVQMVEKPHLGEFMEKLKNGPKLNIEKTYNIPTEGE